MNITRRYLPGLTEALSRVQSMTEAEALAVIDSLFGRENLRYGATADEVRQEAMEQTRRDFENPEYERDGTGEFVRASAAAARAMRS